MRSLQDIAELDPQAQELLEAAGYFDVDALKEHSLNQISDEIAKANSILGIVEIDPTPGVVKKWLAPLEGEIGSFEEAVVEVQSEDFVTERDLLSAAFAIPLSQAFIEKNDVLVDELLTGRMRFLEGNVKANGSATIVADPLVAEVDEKVGIEESEVSREDISEELNTISKEELERPEVDVELDSVEINKALDEILPQTKLNSGGSAKPSSSTESNIAPALNINSTSSSGTVFTDKRDARIDKNRILTMDAFREEGSKVEPLQNAAASDLTRSARKETNAGLDPSSRRFVRGVLHRRLASFKSGLYAYFLSILCVIGGFTLPFLVIVDKEQFFWALYSPLLIFVGLFIYLAFTGRASCPICNQKQFASKRCLKHRNAHHWPVIGYMLPTALHAIFYKWFRCIFCGTSVRIKE